jgi:hypothetical protein
MLPTNLEPYFNFKQHPAFPQKYKRHEFCLLNQKPGENVGDLPFPDMKLFDPDAILRIRDELELPECQYCGAVLIRGMPEGFCCKPFHDMIKPHLPTQMDPELLDRILESSHAKPNFPRVLNRQLRPVTQYACVTSPNAGFSNLFISGIPYAVDSFRQFTSPVYAVFSRMDKHLDLMTDSELQEVADIIESILRKNDKLNDYVRNRLDCVREIGNVSMNEPDPGINLVIFNADGQVLSEQEIEVIRSSYESEKLCPVEMGYDQLVYPLIFWQGWGGCGIAENAERHGATTWMRKVLISLILQPRNYFLHQLTTLREEFICAVFGRLVNIRIKFMVEAQKRYFAREDEIRQETVENTTKDKDYGLRQFIPPSITDSDEYWHHVALKCFAISSQFGPPTFFLTFTMNPYWHEYQALKRGNDVFADSAMVTLIFKQKLASLMKFIKSTNLLGKISAFVWRIEYQKRGLPHAHILFWTDLNTQDVEAVEAVINVRYPKKSPFLKDQNMTEDMHVLIDRFQIHHHCQRCRTADGKCKYGFPQELVASTTIRNHRYQFARVEGEQLIIPNNPELLAHFRSHHCLEVIHSNQCISYVLKYCAKNSDSGHIALESVLYEGHAVTKEQKLEYYAANRIASAPECFAVICGCWRHHMKPTVIILNIHLQGKKIVLTSGRSDAQQKIDNPSPLERYLGRPRHVSHDLELYTEYYAGYSLDPKHCASNGQPDLCDPVNYANPRKKPVICIMNSVPPDQQELFALRLLLKTIPARSWQELYTVNDQVYNSLYQAAERRGLVSDRNQEAIICMEDAVHLNRPPSDLRFLLSQMVAYGADRSKLERIFWNKLLDEGDDADSLSEKIRALIDRHKQGFVPVDDHEQSHFTVQEESLWNSLTSHQGSVASQIIQTLQDNTDQLMFLQGSAGTGKTFTVNTLVENMRQSGLNCLICATTGIAAVQYSGGTTVHSLFHLGFDEQANSSFQSNIGSWQLYNKTISLSRLTHPIFRPMNFQWLAKGRCCRAIAIHNRTLFCEFDDEQTTTIIRVPLDKTSNGMTFVRPVFVGTVHSSQGMTLDRAVIDCRCKYWEHGQLYVALPRVKSPAHICILLPEDMQDFTLRPTVDKNVVQIVESMNSSIITGIITDSAINHPDPVPEHLDNSDDEPSEALPYIDFDSFNVETGHLIDGDVETAHVTVLDEECDVMNMIQQEIQDNMSLPPRQLGGRLHSAHMVVS